MSETLIPKPSFCDVSSRSTATPKNFSERVNWRVKSNQGALATLAAHFPSNETLLKMSEEAADRGVHYVSFEYSPDVYYVLKNGFACDIFSGYNFLTRHSIQKQLEQTVRFLKSNGFRVRYRKYNFIGTPTKTLRWEW